jgi:hypothetical protein
MPPRRPGPQLRLSLALLGALAASAPGVARADWEVWLPMEVRVPILRAPTPGWGRVDWRIISEGRFSGRTEGLEQLFVRTGPVVYVTPFMFVAAHVTYAVDALGGAAPIRMEQEIRAELEPNFFGRLGPITLASRNRLEYRWRQTFERVRFRTQLRANLAPRGWVVMPFAQAELLFDLTDTRLDDPATSAATPPTPGFNQWRAFAGAGLQLSPNVRLDLGVVLRSRQVATATPGQFDRALDVGPWIQLFVDVPLMGR